MPPNVTPTDEALFAAAAQHLIAFRRYDGAIEVLKAYDLFQHRARHLADFADQFAAVSNLLVLIFECSPDPAEPAPALRALRRILATIDAALLRRIRKKRRGKKIVTLYDYLLWVSKRPAMYLGRPSVELLRAYIGPHVMYERRPEFLPERPSFQGFRSWVDRRYPHLQGGGHGWDQILIAKAGGDGPAALNLFFREVAAYRRSAGLKSRRLAPGAFLPKRK